MIRMQLNIGLAVVGRGGSSDGVAGKSCQRHDLSENAERSARGMEQDLRKKRGICNDMIITSKVVLDAMRGRPPTAPSALGRHNPSEHPFGQFSCPFSSDKP